ncbi:MAG: VCBS repeat-containing protein [bacterium]
MWDEETYQFKNIGESKLDFYPCFLTCADFNNDTKTDLAVISSTGKFAILHGNGDGTFGNPEKPATSFMMWYLLNGYYPTYLIASATSADFNVDGNMDLAVISTIIVNVGDLSLKDNIVSVLPGKGDGSFYPCVNYRVGEGPKKVIAVDADGDDMLDLVVSNELDDSIAYLKNITPLKTLNNNDSTVGEGTVSTGNDTGSAINNNQTKDPGIEDPKNNDSLDDGNGSNNGGSSSSGGCFISAIAFPR